MILRLVACLFFTCSTTLFCSEFSTEYEAVSLSTEETGIVQHNPHKHGCLTKSTMPDCVYKTTLVASTVVTCAAFITTSSFTQNGYWILGCLASPLVGASCSVCAEYIYRRKCDH